MLPAAPVSCGVVVWIDRLRCVWGRGGRGIHPCDVGCVEMMRGPLSMIIIRKRIKNRSKLPNNCPATDRSTMPTPHDSFALHWTSNGVARLPCFALLCCPVGCLVSTQMPLHMVSLSRSSDEPTHMRESRAARNLTPTTKATRKKEGNALADRGGVAKKDKGPRPKMLPGVGVGMRQWKSGLALTYFIIPDLTGRAREERGYAAHSRSRSSSGYSLLLTANAHAQEGEVPTTTWYIAAKRLPCSSPSGAGADAPAALAPPPPPPQCSGYQQPKSQPLPLS